MSGAGRVRFAPRHTALAVAVTVGFAALAPLAGPLAASVVRNVIAAEPAPSFRSTLPVVPTNGHAGLYGWGAATLSDGSVIVGDYWNHRVVHYDTSGNYLGVLFNQTGGLAPYGLAVDKRNGTIYAGYDQCCTVPRYGLSNGAYVPLTPITNTNFRYPSRVAVTDDGWVYIADMLANTIFVYDSNLNFQFQIGSRGTGPGLLIQPRGIAFDGSNPQRLYVMDSYNYRVSVFSRTGTFLFSFGSHGSAPGQFPDNNTRGLAIDRANGWVYAVDIGNNLVDKFDLNGNFLLSFGGTGGHSATVCCNTPVGLFSAGGREVTVDGNGNVWVGDMPNFRVQVFSPAGQSLFAEPNPVQLPPPGAFNFPEGVGVDSEGNVIVDDTRNFRIEKFSPSGQFLWQIGLRGRFSGYALNYPNMVATDPSDDSIVIVDDYNNQIKKFDQDGVFEWQVGQSACAAGVGQFCHPVGVATGPDGRIYVTDTHNNRVVELAADGTWLSSFTYANFKSPRGISVDPATQNIFVGDFVKGTVTEFTNSGAFVQSIAGHGTAPGSLKNPWGVAVDGTYVYAADKALNVVKVYSETDGSFVTSFGTHGSGPGQFSGAEAVALGPNGTLYVTDTFNDRIQVWCVQCAGPSAPTYVRTIGATGGPDMYPSGVDVDSAGDVAIADTGNDVISLYAGSSTPAWSVGTRGLAVGGGVDTFEDPRDVALDSTHVFVADTGNQDVQVLNRSNGAFVQTLSWKFSSPYGVSVGTDGSGNERILVSDGGNGNLEVFDGSLNHVMTIPPTSSTEGTRDAAADSAGNIYVADYRNDRVDKYSSAGSLLLQWGGSTAPTCQKITKPYGIAVDSNGHVYVASSALGVIKEFNADGSCVATFGSSGSGAQQFSQLRRVAIGPPPSSLVYGADLWGYKVLVFNQDGTISTTQPQLGDGNPPAPGVLNEVHGIAVTPTYVFATDTVNQRAQRFNLDGSSPVAWSFGTPESTTGFNWPQGAGVNPQSGNVWIADTKNNRIDEFAADGTGPLRSLVNGSGGVALNAPTSVSFDSAGNMYIADSGGNDVRSYSVPASGAPTFRWATGTAGKGTGQFKSPGDAVYDASQSAPRILVADTGNSRLVTLDAATGAWGVVLPMTKGTGLGQVSAPGGLAVSASGTIWVADTGNDRVEAFNPDGTFANQVLGGFGTGEDEFNGPQAIELGPDGLLYVADTQNGRIQVFQPAA